MDLIIDTKFPPLDSKEQILMELINGREPVNDEEKQMVEELKQIEKDGEIPYIPSN